MQELTVCVGESCHLNGAEIVVKHFQKIIETKQLKDRIQLTGSFCIGECNDDGKVSVRWRDRMITVDPETADDTFQQEVLSEIDPTPKEG